MTNTSLAPIASLDRRAILSIVTALRDTLNSFDVAWHHDADVCDRSRECECPTLPDPVRDGLWEALRHALLRTVGDEAAAELLPLVDTDRPFAPLLARWSV